MRVDTPPAQLACLGKQPKRPRLPGRLRLRTGTHGPPAAGNRLADEGAAAPTPTTTAQRPPALNPSPPAHETPPVPLASLLSTAALAADPLQTYEGEVAGLFCSACSSHVKAALEQIDGVESVKILAAPKGGLPRLRLTSRRPLTREQAVAALGDKAKLYDIRSLHPVQP